MSQATLKVAGDTMTYNTVINCLRQRPRAGPPPGSFQRPCRPLQLGAGVLVSSLLVDDVLEFIGDDVLEFIGDDVLEFIGDDVLEFIGDDSSLRAAAGWLSAASLSPLSSRTRRHSGVAAATDAQFVDAGRRQGQGCSVASVTQSATTITSPS